MKCLAFYIATKIEGLNVRIARMIYESWLISIKHTVKAEWEELTLITELNFLLPLFILEMVIHVK
jgi:hypothetical protein